MHSAMIDDRISSVQRIVIEIVGPFRQSVRESEVVLLLPIVRLWGGRRRVVAVRGEIERTPQHR